MSLSTLLQSRVNELEMSISDLARRSGVSRATVIRILGGKDEHYSVSNLQAVLSALGMKMDLLALATRAANTCRMVYGLCSGLCELARSCWSSQADQVSGLPVRAIANSNTIRRSREPFLLLVR